MSNKSRQVYFDFDNTLTSCDTTLAFACAFTSVDKNYLKLASFFLLLIFYRFHIISNTQLKSAFAGKFLAGRNTKEVVGIVGLFYFKYLNYLLLPEVIEILNAHVSNGDDVFIVSANFDCLLDSLRGRLRLKGIIGTQAMVKGDCFTGKLASEACHGIEKLRRVIRNSGDDVASKAIAYGDSPSDTYLLDFADTSFRIVPTEKALSKARNFVVLHLSILMGKRIIPGIRMRGRVIPWQRGHQAVRCR